MLAKKMYKSTPTTFTFPSMFFLPYGHGVALQFTAYLFHMFSSDLAALAASVCSATAECSFAALQGKK